MEARSIDQGDLDFLKTLIQYDQGTGILSWFGDHGKMRHGKAVGFPDKRGYINLRLPMIDGSRWYAKAHRVAWMLTYGTIDTSFDIDHINGNKSDNRLCNLRSVSRQVNVQNRRAKSILANKLGVVCNSLGVSPIMRNGKVLWRARIEVDGRTKYLGRFKTEIEAYNTYIVAKRQMHKGNTL